jgi:5-methylthioadenosine/S-adenosylhomocysteine deaminase
MTSLIFNRVTVLGSDGVCRPDCYVGVRDRHIVYIGDIPPVERFDEEIDGFGKVLTTGFVNAHTHIAMTLMRGYGEDMLLNDWLFHRIFPFEDKLTSEAVYWGSLLGIAEMLKTGTTSFSDMYFFCESTVRAVAQSGIKANIGRGISCFDESLRFSDLPAYRELCELIPIYHGANDGRVCIDVAPHAEYTTRPDILYDAAQLAAKHNLHMQVHVSETEEEHLACVGRHGKTPTGVLAETGVLAQPLTVAHGVYLTDGDRELLAEHRATVAHCPKSNLKLGSGVADIPALQRAGVAVAIGTDSAASNNALNMVEELRMAALLQKGLQRDPTVLPAETVWQTGTRVGALSQGRKDCGEVAVGYRADLVLWDTEVLLGSPLSEILYSGTAKVVLTMVDGKVLYRNGVFTTLDIEKIYHEAKRCAIEIENRK